MDLAFLNQSAFVHLVFMYLIQTLVLLKDSDAMWPQLLEVSTEL